MFRQIVEHESSLFRQISKTVVVDTLHTFFRQITKTADVEHTFDHTQRLYLSYGVWFVRITQLYIATVRIIWCHIQSQRFQFD